MAILVLDPVHPNFTFLDGTPAICIRLMDGFPPCTPIEELPILRYVTPDEAAVLIDQSN